ncbi:chemotaxis protein CheW [Aestuariibacter halophilus]|uniref:Chemotaxis protein CheW n=1 Tax=Fluctibacter halophilus TaxID=226011 RepID=A0ABS8G891_9ALTE|nr:chemotaxis protein CheW [Aestuariibacter halophilus]MCC2616035.1 chemotaxis protein CheW [Aestuariibacter halophilus]
MGDAKEMAVLDEEPTGGSDVREWLSFRLGKLDYAVDILRVLEIRVWESTTRIPYSSPFVQGLINLRGAIVPVIDLRLRLGLSAKQPDGETVILVLNVEHPQGSRTLAMIVDQIQDVIEVSGSDVRSADRFNLNINERFVYGLMDVNSNMTVLLDIDTVLDVDDSERHAS